LFVCFVLLPELLETPMATKYSLTRQVKRDYINLCLTTLILL